MRTRICWTDAMPGHSDASSERQRAVRAHAMSDAATSSKICAKSAYASGTSGHSVLSTISRSTIAISCLNSEPATGGRPRQRMKTGRSETSSGWTTLAGAAARRPSRCSSITSEQTCRSTPGTL